MVIPSFWTVLEAIQTSLERYYRCGILPSESLRKFAQDGPIDFRVDERVIEIERNSYIARRTGFCEKQAAARMTSQT